MIVSVVMAMMAAGWDALLEDNTGLTPKNMVVQALWTGKRDVTSLFRCKTMEIELHLEAIGKCWYH